MAFSKYKLELGRSLAEHVLKKFYTTDQEQQKELQSLCLDNLSNSNMAKIYLKIQREQLNNIVVHSVLEDLPMEKRKFIEMKYKQKFSLVKIAMMLQVSKGQLALWNIDILTNIENMLFYRLSSKDYFNVQKILSMLYILNQQITYLETNCAGLIQSSSFNYLLEKQKEYLKVYQVISSCIESDDNTKVTKVVQARAMLGAVPTTVLAERGGCSIARVSAILKNYHEIIQNLIAK